MKRIPNIITMSRIALSVMILFISPYSTSFIVLYCICGLSDIVDGYIARKFSLESEFGAKLDSLADLEVIKERFSLRMNGRLPEPVAKMLETKHGMFDQIECDYKFSMTDESVEQVCEELLNKLELR